jgi:glycosyltransferase involved in cell wall biosynthesis
MNRIRPTGDDRAEQRVLCVVPTPYVSGLQNVTLRYFEQTASTVRSHFLLTRWSDGEMAQRLTEIGIPYSQSWLGMFSRRLDKHNLRMTLEAAARLPVLYRDFLQLVRRFRPDLLYTANYHELILLYPLLRVLDLPVVCHMHDPPPDSRFYRFVASHWNSVVDSYLVISDSVRSRTARLGINPEKLRLLYNGIDLEEFPFVAKRSARFCDRYGWGRDTIIVGMTGQMNEKKGHKDLLVAAQTICDQNPHVRFVIGGKKHGPYFEELIEFVHSANLSDRVIFSGWEPRVRDFFQAIDVLALPSRHEEGFGLVIAEAMATGRPVVVTRSGGAAEVVEDGVMGLVIDRACPSELADALQTLISSAELRSAMGQAGRRRVENRFDLSKQSRSFQELLLNVGVSHHA